MTPTFSRGKLPSDELEKLQLPRISRQLPKKSVADLLAGFKAANAVRPFTYHAVREPITEKISAWENLLK